MLKNDVGKSGNISINKKNNKCFTSTERDTNAKMPF